ncbi:TRAP transporter large permease [Sulfitobacter pseudonitzschiae]|uniref:TRAP transporter large permease protein n=1 Tax=Pseudooceanicola atlanticus TaxID=1461694 RepID=A0A0A0E680_9RHOB|nr:MULTISPECIES: TRAP transporter large permease [Rhodobacterales]KGM46531.1 C4-dicarboxylate ABC transporter permease [Pseudooceanicola atlanticus]MBM1817038.1 TRAP transporter large permease [Pseudosulfitobacter pseudonitzschiae]MBM1835128.1 TRAP transporter large permease [Pseudosulfitobacter pseudonitzschiae]MBM1840001.1 TRAP transporter large permease [Pseudosulfitobacter pseudonitzschiae]MBM1844864.1 TRAP transporter large permease [Pseudosulfitobacter pseudonitzschiae]
MSPIAALSGFLALLVAGFPVFLVLGIVSLVLFAAEGRPMVALPQLFIDHLKSDTLVSVPFFVIAATFMQRGGIAKALVDFTYSWIGGVRGGIALVCVLATMVFSAISGSSVATAMAMGTLLVPAMRDTGYDEKFALGVVASSGTLGILIPPSLAMILFAVVAGESVPQLFLAGVIPGMLQVGIFAAWIIYVSRRRGYAAGSSMSRAEFWAVNRRALPAMLLPLIILGGIYSGLVTVNEAAGMAAFVSIVVSVVFYKGCTLSELPRILADAIQATAVIFFITIGALAFGHWITSEGFARQMVDYVTENELSAWHFLLLINLVMFMLGMFLETIAVILIVVPLVLPLLAPLGIDPVHFAVIIVINMEIALLTPPVGLNLFIMASTTGAPVDRVARGVLPFIALLLVLLAMVTFIPKLSLFLPEMFYGR